MRGGERLAAAGGRRPLPPGLEGYPPNRPDLWCSPPIAEKRHTRVPARGGAQATMIEDVLTALVAARDRIELAVGFCASALAETAREEVHDHAIAVLRLRHVRV